MSGSTLKITLVPVARLKPNPDNVKDHTPEQIEQLRASIRRFGFRDPIGVDGKYRIIEGHGRYQAALAEGLAEVPVIRLTHMSAREAQAYAIAHNQTQLRSGLDMGRLSSELTRLEAGDADFLSLGFREEDVLFLDMGGDMGGAAGADAGQAGGETGDATGGGAAETSAWNGLVQPIVKSTLRFRDAAQMQMFTSLLDLLAHRYLDEPTVAARLLRFARENDPASA